ncbi:MAG: ATP-dependent Clp protease ATP-binding subunit [Clostridia bacterium]|nr:ATP-dependent Clp protease ATP-binding subunit [Clostridia bacterium]
MTYKFTKSSENVLKIANDLAEDMGHSYIGTEHILYGLVAEGTGVASKVLENQNIVAEDVLEKIEALIGSTEISQNAVLGFTPRTKKILENAFMEAKKLGSDYIGTEHILIGIMKEGDSIAVRIMLDLGIRIEDVYNEIVRVLNDFESISNGNLKNAKGSYNNTQTLNQFGTDLSMQAMEGKLDPVIGRNIETERVIEILSRRTKNNPCLLGEPGVGKTAVIEGLAQRIVAGNVPENLKNKRVVTLDVSSMVAGAKYRGDFEERIKKVLGEVKKAKDVILFIDEIHTIVGAGAADGAIDAANILKPMLARREIQLVGATTPKEYRKNIERDSALERRFQPVQIEEPSIEEAEKILKGIRDKYEAHHNVKITDEAIEAAVELSSKYINDRYLPDKAIDLIDEASVKSRLKTYIAPENIKKLEDKFEKTVREKEDAINIQDFEKAAKLRDKEKELSKKLDEENEKWRDARTNKVINIDKEDVAVIVSNWTGIPVSKISESENEKLKSLEEELHKRVIGQDEAVSAVAKAIRRSRVGLKDPNRPIGSFLFLGPTGVGKTELTKALAECLFGSESAMIRVDMSEFMEQHSVSKLIGSPPGYVGYEEAGGLTEQVRKKLYSVILFDEIEKAHPDVMNLLLQILDDGRLTDSQGRVINFKNTVIIMTSNIGARNITDKKTLGFGNYKIEEEYENIKRDVMQEVKQMLKPEFINRIDEIIVFHKLTKNHIEKIIDIMLNDVQEKIKKQNVSLIIEQSAKDFILARGTDDNFGARPLRRTIQNYVEDKLAEFILDGIPSGKNELIISADGKEISVKLAEKQEST